MGDSVFRDASVGCRPIRIEAQIVWTVIEIGACSITHPRLSWLAMKAARPLECHQELPIHDWRIVRAQNRTLHHTTTRTASAFDDAPVTVLLAVLPSPRESQVHGPRFYAQVKSGKEGRSSLHAFPPHSPLKRFGFCTDQIPKSGRQEFWEKEG